MIRLDVIVPTYNRSGLLALCLKSLLATPAPPELAVAIWVMDNNSVDDTRATVERMQQNAAKPLHYVLQPLQGLSHSRNAGIAAGVGDVLGFVDDDEQIGPLWYHAIARELSGPGTDYLSGPCLADAEVSMPGWVPEGYHGILGITPVRARQPMGEAFPGNLMGGNAVVRRTVFERVGLFNTSLGRSATGLQSDEDVDLYRRIKAAGFSGFFVPDMTILHHIPADRLTRRYYRRWCYGRGISQGIAEQLVPEPVVHLLGVPRYRLRAALSGLLQLPFNLGGQGNGNAFTRELPFWTQMGFLRGRFFTRTPAAAEGKS